MNKIIFNIDKKRIYIRNEKHVNLKNKYNTYIINYLDNILACFKHQHVAENIN